MCKYIDKLIKDKPRPSITEGAFFDAEDHAKIVYNPKTNQLGEMWPLTWFGTVIFLEDLTGREDVPLAHVDVVFDDMDKMKDFNVVCDK